MATPFYNDPTFYNSALSLDPSNQQRLNSMGITQDQLAQLMAQNSAANPGANVAQVPGGSGQTKTVNTVGPGASGLASDMRTLQLVNQMGLGGGQQQAPSKPGAVSYDPTNLATNLGAAALNMPAIYNPTPQEASGKGGVGKITKATTSDVVPDVTAGPWINTPSIFNKAHAFSPTQGAVGGQQAITPTPQANAAVMGAPTPWAQAPPAPGIQVQGDFAGAHTSALADAGRALYAHFGGDPNTANHADIANFHSQLTGMIGAAGQGGPTIALAPTGNTGASKEPVKMQYGGLVPGDPDAPIDSVKARLTPGEYVIPRPEVKRLTERPAALAKQGAPTNAPPAPGAAQTQNQQGDSANSSAPSTQGSGIDWNAIAAARTMRQNAQLSANMPAYPSATTPAAQGYAAAANAGQIGGAAPSAATIQGAAAMTPAQTQGSIAGAGAAGARAAGAISGLASGLTAAAQKYADSIKSWQVQKSAIPDPDAFKRDQQVTLNPMIA